MTGHSYIVLLLTLPFLRSHYFISPPIPLFLETLQKTFPKNRDTKKKIYRQIIPPNTYIPLASNTPGVLVSSGLCNTSAFEVFRLISDLEHYKVWAGYGIQSITVSDDMKYGSAIAKYEAGAFGFSFVFSLHWEFFYAQDNKPFYASFRLLEKTNLLDKIEGQYTITAVQNQSICNVDFVLATSLKGVPGFLQRRIKQVQRTLLYFTSLSFHFTLFHFTKLTLDYSSDYFTFLMFHFTSLYLISIFLCYISIVGSGGSTR